jgi:glycosyltransferase involved in cell wall biosynthesis
VAGARGLGMPVGLDAIAWTRFQPRTSALALALGGQARFVDDGFAGRHFAMRPFAYLVKAYQTWTLLSRDNPKTVLVITPPVFAPLVAWLWCLVHRRALVVDCHTGAFHSPKWAWARPLHRWLLRRVRAVLLHTDELEALVTGWGARAMVVPDDLPSADEARPQERDGRTRVLIAGSLDSNEPVATVVEAARLLPDLELRFTGDPSLVPDRVRAEAPPNVVWTGYLAYPVFLGELEAADVVGVFSTDPRIMNRAAFEAVGLGRPLVLSDLPGLRDRFSSAALFAANEPAAIAGVLRGALDEKSELARRSVALQSLLRTQREQAVARLQSIIDGGGSDWRQRSAS